MRTTTRAAAIVCIAVGISVSGIAPAQADDTPDHVLLALQRITSQSDTAATTVLAGRARISARGFGDHRVANGDNEVIVSIPREARAGITLTDSDSPALGISLPFAAQASSGKALYDGTIVYANDNNTSTVPIVKEDGSVQITTVITDQSAPTSFTYGIDVAGGASLAMDEETGAVTITDASGAFVGGIASPWARDANGWTVPTRYEIHGTSVTQVVEHDLSFKYPIVADPWMGKDLISYQYLSWPSQGYVVNVIPTQWGRTYSGQSTLSSHLSELISKLGVYGDKVTPTVREQFYCHIYYNVFESGTYNMESWRPYVDWGWSILQQCNPS